MPRPQRVKTTAAGVAVHQPGWQACPSVDEKPTYSYVFPTNSTYTSAWGAGQGTYSEYRLTPEFGNVVDGFLRIGVNFTGALPRPNLTPTTCWVDHIETWCGSDLIETVYRTELHDELFAFRRAQDASNLFFTHNLESNFTEVVDASGANVMTDGYFYLNLWEATCLKSWRPFVAGYTANIFIRVYWASSIVTDAVPANVQVPSMYEATLIVEQAVMSKTEFAAALAYHKNPGNAMITNVVRRERVQSSAMAITANNTTQVVLQGMQGTYAGMLVYVVPASQTANIQSDNDILLNKGSLQYMQLLGAAGEKITEQLYTGTLSAESWPGDLDSNFPNVADATVNSLFLLPFSSAFQLSVNNGCDYGKRQFLGTEILYVNPGAAGTAIGASQIVTVVGYRCGSIAVSGGQHKVTWQ
jgi:hypothetical protein